MARVKRAVHANKKRREVLSKAKGYYGQKSRSYKNAKQQVIDYKATENIIRAIQFYNKKCKLLYISSTSVYDNSEGSEVTIASKLTTNEFDYYSLGKIKIEKLIKDNIKNYVI